MSTQVYFEDIKSHIIRELNNANISILVAVAWFTDLDLFKLLCRKAECGVNVEVIIANDEINFKSKINYDSLNKYGGKVYIDPLDTGSSLMHNKFCVIDLKTTITGSYNWSYQARHNRENITITNDERLSERFARHFYFLKTGKRITHNGLSNKESVNLCTYLKRIEKLITENQFADIDNELFLLKNIDYIDEKTANVLVMCDNKMWDRASKEINDYLNLKQQLVVFENFEIRTLQFQKEALILKLDRLVITKEELEKNIYQFNITYNQELGDILLEFFEIKNRYGLEFEESYEQTKKDMHIALNTQIRTIDDACQEKLKKMYKKAALICHPDKVHASMKSEAERVFKQLNNAYRNNDYDLVEEIYENLKLNNYFIHDTKYSTKETLINEINRIIFKINQIKFEIDKLKITAEHQILMTVHDWPLFYKLEKEKILARIYEIQKQFEHSNHGRKRN